MIQTNSYYQTNNYGTIYVLSQAESSDTYTVQFVNTGTIKDVRGHQIKSGSIRDPYAKSVCGVGCTGNIKTKGKYKPYYSIWHDMINRCYNPNNKRFNAYQDVTVSEDWLTFEYFYKDIQTMDSFNADLIEQGVLVLDKDIEQRFKQHKIYSKETCRWVSKQENNEIQDHQQKVFYAIDPNGVQYTDYNITRFAREHNLDRRHISSVLHKRTKTTQGWRFSYEEIV